MSLAEGLFPKDQTRHEEYLDGICKHLGSYLRHGYEDLGGIPKNLPAGAFPAEIVAILSRIRSQEFNPNPTFIILQLMIRELNQVNMFEIAGRAPQIALYATKDMDYAQSVAQCFNEQTQ